MKMSDQDDLRLNSDVILPSEDEINEIRHRIFTTALERLPIHDLPPAFLAQHLAEELGWSLDETTEYVYKYLRAILEMERNKAYEQIGGAVEAINDGWSDEESLLFDTLAARYTAESREGVEWVDLIARHLPGRSPEEVRHRWTKLYELSKKK